MAYTKTKLIAATQHHIYILCCFAMPRRRTTANIHTHSGVGACTAGFNVTLPVVFILRTHPPDSRADVLFYCVFLLNNCKRRVVGFTRRRGVIAAREWCVCDAANYA